MLDVNCSVWKIEKNDVLGLKSVYSMIQILTYSVVEPKEHQDNWSSYNFMEQCEVNNIVYLMKVSIYKFDIK